MIVQSRQIDDVLLSLDVSLDGSYISCSTSNTVYTLSPNLDVTGSLPFPNDIVLDAWYNQSMSNDIFILTQQCVCRYDLRSQESVNYTFGSDSLLTTADSSDVCIASGDDVGNILFSYVCWSSL